VRELLTVSVHSMFSQLRVREGDESTRGNPEVVEMRVDKKESKTLGGGSGAVVQTTNPSVSGREGRKSCSSC